MREHRKKVRLTPSLPGARRSARPSAKKRLWPILVIVIAVTAGASALIFMNFRKDRTPGLDGASVAAAPLANPSGNNSGAAAALDSRVASLISEANDQMSKGDTKGAIETYKRALELNPKSEDLHYNLGIAYRRAGSLTNAEYHYQQALLLLPEYPEAHNNYGNLLMRMGRVGEAEQHFKEAIKILPEYASAHNSLGILKQQQKLGEEAQACFEKAVHYNSNYWEARFNLASSYLGRGDRDKAAAELRETLRLNPSFEAAQRELDKLQDIQVPFPAR